MTCKCEVQQQVVLDSGIVQQYIDADGMVVYECNSSVSCPSCEKEVGISFEVKVKPQGEIVEIDSNGIDEDEIRSAFED